MNISRVESLRIKAKLLQKAKLRADRPFALKEAFATIAMHSGFRSWQEMKAAVEEHEPLRPIHASALCSIWFGTHAEGKAHLRTEKGFLLPYQKQCFFCDANYIANLGVRLDDPDLIAVGNDWVVPADQSAWDRLLGKIRRTGVHP